MGRRRKQGLLDVLIRLPWWMGAVVAVLILAIRPIWLAWAVSDAGMFAPLMHTVANISYFFAVIFAIGALASLIRQWWNGRLLEKQALFPGLDNTIPAQPNASQSLAPEKAPDLTWRQFEGVIQELFRRQGYLSVETQSGPDGGYDIALRKDGKRYLVQCKQWQAQKVGVGPVRELWGVIAASKADGGFFVTSGSFTLDAQAFARGVDLELIDGEKLERLLMKASSKPVTTSERFEPNVMVSPSCPKCGGEMVRRIAKKGMNASREFWGCSMYPRCLGTAG